MLLIIQQELSKGVSNKILFNLMNKLSAAPKLDTCLAPGSAWKLRLKAWIVSLDSSDVNWKETGL